MIKKIIMTNTVSLVQHESYWKEHYKIIEISTESSIVFKIVTENIVTLNLH